MDRPYSSFQSAPTWLLVPSFVPFMRLLFLYLFFFFFLFSCRLTSNEPYAFAYFGPWMDLIADVCSAMKPETTFVVIVICISFCYIPNLDVLCTSIQFKKISSNGPFNCHIEEQETSEWAKWLALLTYSRQYHSFIARNLSADMATIRCCESKTWNIIDSFRGGEVVDEKGSQQMRVTRERRSPDALQLTGPEICWSSHFRQRQPLLPSRRPGRAYRSFAWIIKHGIYRETTRTCIVQL